MVAITFSKFSLAIIVVVSFYLVTNAQYFTQECYDDFGTYSRLSDYGTNINKAITQLASSASTSYFDTITVGKGSDKVNALYTCRYDVSNSVCENCVESTLNNVSSCFRSVEGYIIYQECSVHYSNNTIFGVMEPLPRYSIHSFRTIEDDGEFIQLLSETITGSISDATSELATSSQRYFSTMTGKYSDGQTLYTLAQCNDDITSSACRTCLQSCIGNFTEKYPGAFLGQMFTPSCRLSYRLSDRKMSPPYDFTIQIVSNTTTETPSFDSPSSSSFNPPPPSSFDDDFNPPPRVVPSRGFNPPSSPGRSFSSTGTKSMSTVGAFVASVSALIISFNIYL